MKKVVLIVLVVWLCMILASCRKQENIKGDCTSLNHGERLKQSAEEGLNEEWLSYPFPDYEAYQEFLKENELPEDFVRYEDVWLLGEFQGLTILSNMMRGDYTCYMYKLTDKTGYTFYLYVKHLENSEREFVEANSAVNVNTEDMRCLKSGDKGIFIQDGVEYDYVNGKLNSIQWQQTDILYTISSSNPYELFSNYPENADTAIGYLMNASDAENVMMMAIGRNKKK